DRAQPRGPNRRRDHGGQEGVRHGPCRARRFGQRIRRAGGMRRPSRRPDHVADDRFRRRPGRRRWTARVRATGVTATGEPATARPAPDAGGPPGPSVALPYPGPRAARIIERMRAVEGAGPRTGADDPPLVVETATGST